MTNSNPKKPIKGFTKSVNNEGIFSEIDWSTDKVFTQTMQAIQAINKSVYVLPKWYDIDTISDLKRSNYNTAAMPAT